MTGKEFKIKRAMMEMREAEFASVLEINPNTVSRCVRKIKIPKVVELT